MRAASPTWHQLASFIASTFNDQGNQGRWLAQADFAERPLPDELPAELPVLTAPGRYEVRVCVWQRGQEIGGWQWLQDGPAEDGQR